MRIKAQGLVKCQAADRFTNGGRKLDINTCTDYGLIQNVLSGCDDSFTELVNRYKGLVYSVILRQVKDKDLANDYAQDVFFKVYKNLKSYSDEFKFSTWVMRITGNHIIDMHRKKKIAEVSYEEHAETLEKMPGFADSAESMYLKKEESKRLAKIVEDLPEMYKLPVVLYHEEGRSYQEIADALGEPLSKVKNRIFRGRKILSAKLAENADGGV